MRNVRPRPTPRRTGIAAEAWRLRERILGLARHSSLRDPVSAMCEEARLTPPQIHSLLWLGHDRPLTMGELSRRVGVTEKTGTGLVDRLEQGGYAARERDPDDRRVVRARLSPRGARVFGELDAAIDQKLVRLLGLLDGPDRRDLTRILDKLIARMEAEAAAKNAAPLGKENP
jgi:DNA-binding MarR family transcriptional regulator